MVHITTTDKPHTTTVSNYTNFQYANQIKNYKIFTFSILSELMKVFARCACWPSEKKATKHDSPVGILCGPHVWGTTLFSSSSDVFSLKINHTELICHDLHHIQDKHFSYTSKQSIRGNMHILLRREEYKNQSAVTFYNFI
jgi:hypothetical protein